VISVPGRLVLLATTPRVAPGLLTGAAWALLRDADEVLCADAEHPLLAELAADDLTARVVEGSFSDAFVAEGLSVWLLEPGEAPDDVGVEVVHGSSDLHGAHLLDLVAVMDRLRSPGGCPWDAQQTHESLVEYLVEEAYEAVEAIETADDDELREELGDVLLQVMFHARIAQEHDVPWDIDDVADGITRKLIRRHPHVFADGDASTAEQVEASWKALKAAEKGRESVTDGIPSSLPALVLAAKLLRRSAGIADVDWVAVEVEDAVERALEAVDGDVGDLLLALVNRLGATDLDAEQELRASIRTFRAAVRRAEGLTS
jgi:XTP/dITP diphosphohydrolase